MKSLKRILRAARLGLVVLMGTGAIAMAQNNKPVAAGDTSASAAAQKSSPANRVGEAAHQINFINNGPANITLQRTDDECMYDSGPGTIFVGSFQQKSIIVKDKNSGLDCVDAAKTIDWTAYTNYQGGNSYYSVEFNHADSSGWVTSIIAPQGNSNGTGYISSAFCAYNFICLNHAIADTSNDPVTIYFDGNYTVTNVTITSPASGGHVDGSDPSSSTVTGTGTPGGQVEVWSLPTANVCGGTDNRYASKTSVDSSGNWSAQAVFGFPPSQNYTIQACQTLNGYATPSAFSTFASWASLAITRPPSGVILASNTTSVTLGGTGEPGATLTPVQVSPSSGVSPCAPSTIGSNGQWSCAVSGLASGTSYQISVQQSKSGQSDPSVGISFTVATPVTITQPTAGQQFPIQTTQVLFKGNGQKNATLSVSVPGATSCPDQIISNNGQWSCTVSGLQPGKSYTASVVQGSSKTTPPSMAWTDPPVTRAFSVAGFAPLTIANPANGQMFDSTTTRIQASGAGQTGAELTVNVPGATTCPKQTIQGGQWSCGISGLASTRSYTLTATQSLGSATYPPQTVSFSVAAPVAVELPKENTVFPAETTEVAMSGTGQPGAAITITTNNMPPCYANVAADGASKGQWRCVIRPLTFGTSYTANVVQHGSGWSDPPVPRHFSIGQPKAISIQSPPDGATVSSNNPHDGLRVTGSGQDGATAQVKVGNLQPQTIYIREGTWATKAFDISSYGATGAALKITATQYLDTVPQGQAEVNITVAKVAAITSPTEGQVVSTLGTMTVAGTGQNGATIQVQLMQNGGDQGGCQASVNNGNWSCSLSGIAPDSTYTLVAIQSGKNPSWSDAPITRKFSTRTTRPLVITYPGNLGNVSPDTPYDVRGTAEPGAQIEVKLFNLISLGKTTVDPYGNWDFRNLLESEDGCYGLAATQILNGYLLTNASDRSQVQYVVGSPSCRNTTVKNDGNVDREATRPRQ